MTLLVGRDDTASFTGTYAYSGGASYMQFNGGDVSYVVEPQVAAATGSADKLGFYISSWGSQTNIKCCIYDNSKNLLETVIIPSSAGAGSILVDLAGTSTITSGNNYYFGFYLETNTATTLYVDTTSSDRHMGYSSTGSYASPVDPIPNGSNVASNREIAWWIESTGPSITSSPATIVDGELDFSIVTTGFAGAITDVSLRSKQNNTHSVSLTFSESAGTLTTDSPDFKSNTNETGIAGCPFTTTYDTLEFVVTDGTDTAVVDVIFNPASGYDEVKTSATPSVATGSIAENWEGFYEDVTAVSVANPSTLTVPTTGMVTGQDCTLSGFTTTPTVNTEYVFTITNGTSGTIPENVTVVTDGVGKWLTGVANEHGQVMFITTDCSVAATMIITHSRTSNFYVQYFDYVDSLMKAIPITVTSGSGTGSTSLGLSLGLSM